jgi:predicted DNA-binding transcriptional regulator YafY
VPVVKPDRLYALKLLLERGQCVPMSDILQRLEISRATAKRDLEFLRDRMGVPVQWDAFGRGYSIRCETRRPEGAPHELPGLWFTDQEVAALLTMYELVAEADDTGQVRQDLLSLQRRRAAHTVRTAAAHRLQHPCGVERRRPGAVPGAGCVRQLAGS